MDCICADECVFFPSLMVLSYFLVLLQGNDLYNLNLAFDVADKHLDIPKMLDAEGMHC